LICSRILKKKFTSSPLIAVSYHGHGKYTILC
jgi:hypothetical protein